MNNIGHAILILGSLYFHYVYGLDPLITFLLCAFALITWSYAGFSKEREKLFKAQIEFFQAKAEYYRKRNAKQ